MSLAEELSYGSLLLLNKILYELALLALLELSLGHFQPRNHMVSMFTNQDGN
jgi:hypothetical protein